MFAYCQGELSPLNGSVRRCSSYSTTPGELSAKFVACSVGATYSAWLGLSTSVIRPSSLHERRRMQVLDHILRFMTLGTVIVGSIAIYAAIYTNNKRLGAEIFLKYSDRISDVRRNLPLTAFDGRDASCNLDMTPEERRAAHEIIYSIFELYELKVHGYLPSAIWKIREPDIERTLSLPIFRQELAALESRFARHPRLASWLEQVRRI
jgi:hypothetical protein